MDITLKTLAEYIWVARLQLQVAYEIEAQIGDEASTKERQQAYNRWKALTVSEGTLKRYAAAGELTVGEMMKVIDINMDYYHVI